MPQKYINYIESQRNLLFFLIPTVLSIIIVFILTKKFMIKKNTAQEEEVDE